MKKHTRSIRLLVGIALIAIFLLTSTFLAANAAEDTIPALESDRVEYSPEVMLTEDDLPGFHLAAETEVVGHLALARRLTAGLSSPRTRITNIAYFSIDDLFRSEFIISFLAYPMSEDDEISFDALVSNPHVIIESLLAIAQTSGNAVEPRFIPELGDLGERSMGFFLSIGQEPVAQNIDLIWVQRGEILQGTWVIYPVGETPTFDVRDVGLLVDQRVQEHFIGTTFRPAGLYVPDLTTHIPTPLDVSTKPAVIGTNLLLAALLMLPFAAAVTLFTHLVSESETSLRQRIHLPGWLSKLKRKDAPGSGAKRRKTPGSILRFCTIMLFYGVIFSLLDRTWQPFTTTGLLLLSSMILAYGIVGIADDIVQWRALRKWGMPAELSLRPTNIILSIGSTLASRLLTLVPGMMFGKPQALVVDEARLDDRKRNQLLRISALTLLTIGFGLWALTTITEIMQRGVLAEKTGNVISGLEAILLIIFAVTLQNTFVQMLGFSGSFGEAFRKKNPWLWMLSLTGISFVFYHTLINPRGELAEALQESNVLLLFGVSGAFMLFTLVWWLFKRIRSGKDKTGANTVSRETSRKSTPKRAAKKSIPAWVWLAVNVVGLMVIGTLLLIWQERLQFQTASTAASTDSPITPTSSVAPEPAVRDQVNPEFAVPTMTENLCYLASFGSFPGKIYDNAIWRGIQLVAAQYGTQTVYADPLTLDDAGYGEAIGQLVQQDCGLIVGYDLLRQTFLTAAAEHPTREFMLLGDLDWQSDLPNLWVTEYDLCQGTYLAGYLAAAFSDSSTVGTFAVDFPPPRFSQDCFVHGVNDYNKTHLTSVFVLAWGVPSQQGLFANDFLSSENGSRLSEQLIAQDADVIAGIGAVSTGYEAGLSALRHAGVTLIGVDVDWAWGMPDLSEAVLTSVETRFNQSIAIAVQALADGTFSGREHEGTLASGEIRLSPLRGFADRVSPELTAELARLASAPSPIYQPAQPAAAGSTLPTSTSVPTPSPTEAPTPTPTLTPIPAPTLGEKISLSDL